MLTGLIWTRITSDYFVKSCNPVWLFCARRFPDPLRRINVIRVQHLHLHQVFISGLPLQQWRSDKNEMYKTESSCCFRSYTSHLYGGLKKKHLNIFFCNMHALYTGHNNHSYYCAIFLFLFRTLCLNCRVVWFIWPCSGIKAAYAQTWVKINWSIDRLIVIDW